MDKSKRGRKRIPEELKKKQIATRIDPKVRKWLRDQEYMPQAILIEKALRKYRVFLEKQNILNLNMCSRIKK